MTVAHPLPGCSRFGGFHHGWTKELGPENVRSATTVLATAFAMPLAALPTLGQKAISPAGPGPCSDADSKTYLLFPFMANQANFDTGVSTANTGSDPFGTVGLTGSCTPAY